MVLSLKRAAGDDERYLSRLHDASRKRPTCLTRRQPPDVGQHVVPAGQPADVGQQEATERIANSDPNDFSEHVHAASDVPFLVTAVV